jgi:hypothetical protein
MIYMMCKLIKAGLCFAFMTGFSFAASSGIEPIIRCYEQGHYSEAHAAFSAEIKSGVMWRNKRTPLNTEHSKKP